MPEILTFVVEDTDITGNRVTYDLDAEGGTPSLANEVTITDNTTRSFKRFGIRDFGGTDGQVDKFIFDMSTFQTNFEIYFITLEEPQDQIIILDADSVVDNGDGTHTITYTGSDSNQYQVTVDPGVAQLLVPDGTVDGTTGDDTMDVGFIDGDGDQIGTGADSILGYAGNDSIQGGDGNDTIDGGDGADTIDGGTGNDSIIGGGGSDTIVLTDGFGDDTVNGTDGAFIDPDIDVLSATALTEAVDITFGIDPEDGTLVGGTSGDTVTFSNIESTVLTDQADTVDGSAATTGFDVDAGAGNDTITGGSGADTLTGGAGADTIDGGDGADSVVGGAGNDQITVDQGDTVTGGDGDDYFTLVDLDTTGSGNAAITIVGGEGGETLGDTLQLTPDVTYDDITFTDTGPTGLSGNFTMADGTVVTFSEIENIICFTPGARILTAQGERPVESLKVGDIVVTRDNGLQPIRWIGRRTVPGRGRFAPIRISADVLEGARNDLLVSPQHRILFNGYHAQLLFGESEVLAAAKHMIDGCDIRMQEQETVTYIHLMFDRHEIIYAEGIATESFYAGDEGVSAIGAQNREELFQIFPELRSRAGSHLETARICLKKHEIRLLADRQFRTKPRYAKTAL